MADHRRDMRVDVQPGRLYVETREGWRELGWTDEDTPFSVQLPDLSQVAASFRPLQDALASLSFTAPASSALLRRFARAWLSRPRWGDTGPRPLCINGAEYHRRQRRRRRG